MPKSKHGKSRRPPYRNQARQQPTAHATATAVTPGAPVTPAAAMPKTTAPKNPAARAAAAAKSNIYAAATTAQYPFFTSELKRIGVITVILLIVLIVLSIVIK